MPHDIEGTELKVGDTVLVECTVESITATEDYCNCNLRTSLPMPPYTTGTTLTLNTKQVQRVNKNKP